MGWPLPVTGEISTGMGRGGKERDNLDAFLTPGLCMATLQPVVRGGPAGD